MGDQLKLEVSGVCPGDLGQASQSFRGQLNHGRVCRRRQADVTKEISKTRDPGKKIEDWINITLDI